MNPNEYQKLAERTSAIVDAMDPNNIRLTHASLGMLTEAGEFADHVKRSIFYKKPKDVPSMSEELGDLMWYIAEACNALSIDLDEVMEINIDKLTVRYPDKFDCDKANNRDTEKEKESVDANNKSMCPSCCSYDLVWKRSEVHVDLEKDKNGTWIIVEATCGTDSKVECKDCGIQLSRNERKKAGAW